MKNNFIKLLVLTTASMSSIAFSSAPAGVKLDSVTTSGTGCPVGSNTKVSLNSRGTVLRMSFENLEAISGAGASISDSRKFCQVVANLVVPEGWTYAVKSFRGLGEVQLDDATSAKQTITTYFQGNLTNNFTTEKEIVAPSSTTVRTSVNNTDLKFAPCDRQRALNIKVSLQAKAENDAFAKISYSRAGGDFLNAALVWKQCD